ncbi:hypothetical protein [Selenihalanaerobacter shriftii]|uniref:Uncharacterized protein n=1 Tax=Selenihalanaerobacter shriftii TaxID=142842 RepID=A0A1T4KW54_9FIRM|nr:hypothetical protein [Selenihalanaerobacter shriftii]SJZ46593.1 hypothetical protein SAMN02745118_00906 [Selenihalanaerobacter shriftii]
MVARKALINICIFFMILATIFLTVGIIFSLTNDSLETKVLPFLGTIICLLFALLAKPTGRIKSRNL